MVFKFQLVLMFQVDLNLEKWTKHGKSPYIDYGTTVSTPAPEPSQLVDDWLNRLNAEIARQGFSSYPTVKKRCRRVVLLD